MGRNNKYIALIIVLLAVAAAGFIRSQDDARASRWRAVHSAHTQKYKDAVLVARLHQNHFKRHRFHLDGWLPVQQDTMISIVTGTSAVAFAQDQPFITPATALLRGPPAA